MKHLLSILILFLLTGCMSSSSAILASNVAPILYSLADGDSFRFYNPKTDQEKDEDTKTKTNTQVAQVDFKSEYIKAVKLHQNRNFQAAFKILNPIANQGYVHAQGLLGMMYENGEGVTRNQSKAIEWYRKAAAQDSAEAQYMLGEIYRLGKGVRKDLPVAFQFYLAAANQGDVDAQYTLAVMYYMGDGTRQSYAGAVKWFSQARYQGYGPEAKEWHEKSCLQLYKEVNFDASKMPKVCENI